MDLLLSDDVHVVDTDFLSHTRFAHIRSNPEKKKKKLTLGVLVIKH